MFRNISVALRSAVGFGVLVFMTFILGGGCPLGNEQHALLQ